VHKTDLPSYLAKQVLWCHFTNTQFTNKLIVTLYRVFV